MKVKEVSKKKRVFQQDDKIVCCTNRFVLDWGYEHTFEDCLQELATEAGVNSARWDDLEWNIFQTHPLFKDCQESYEEFSRKLGETFRVDGLLGSYENHVQTAAVKAVRAHAYQRLLRKMRQGNERKLFFGEITEPPPYSVVLEKKIVHTGLYYPPQTSYSSGEWGCECDCESGGLTDRKVRVLLWVSPFGGIGTKPCLPGDSTNIRMAKKYTHSMGQCYLLADECIFLKEAQVTERLRGEKLEWGKVS